MTVPQMKRPPRSKKDLALIRVFAFSSVRTEAKKAEALNFGIGRSKAEIVIAMDADTLFEKDTIGKLVRRFEIKEVGAVAGNAKVGNRVEDAYTLAGSGIHNLPEPRPPGIRYFELHHGFLPGAGRCMETGPDPKAGGFAWRRPRRIRI